MGKSVHNDVLDAALDYISTNGDRICICSSEPTTYTEATSTYELADVDITSGDYTGPADGDTSGRKLTVNAQASITIDVTGTAEHVAIVDTGTSKLLYVTTCTAQSLTAAGLTNIPAWDIELRDPT